MFGKKKDEQIPFSEWEDEIIASMNAATSDDERAAVIAKFSTKYHATERSIRGYLSRRGVGINSQQIEKLKEIEQKYQTKKEEDDSSDRNQEYTSKKHEASTDSNKDQTVVKQFTMSSMEISDYVVVKGKSSAELVQNVKEKMRTGWQPYGAVGAAAFGMSPIGGNQYIQAMVKYLEK